MTTNTREPTKSRLAGAAASFPFLDGSKPSKNGGSGGRVWREPDPKSRHGGTAPAARSVSGEPAERVRASALARGAEHGGSRATGAPAAYSPLAGEWADKHHEALAERERTARMAAMRSGKPWTLHADEQTRKVLADCPERDVAKATAAEYRRVYDRLRASGLTPLEAASTRNHYDKLRTACRFCMEQDARAWRAASDRARKRGDLESAQRRTKRAFNLAAVMDELFMQGHRRTWRHKAAEMKAAGLKPGSKSKRATRAPAPDMAGVALLTGRRHGDKVAHRHAERLAVIALFGMRPAELKKGVVLRVVDGGRFLTAQVRGAKVSEKRGQEARVIRVPVEGSAATGLAEVIGTKGGKWTMRTTDADHRSLNRALRGDLSCYSFRHQTGSDLKTAIAAGETTAEEAAAIMGHRSTASLSAYGTRSRGRGGRRLRANATHPVRKAAVAYEERATLRAERKKAKAAAGRVRVKPSPQARTKAAPKAANARIPRQPKPPRM